MEVIKGCIESGNTITVRYRSVQNGDQRITGTIKREAPGKTHRIYVTANREPPSIYLEKVEKGWLLFNDRVDKNERMGVVKHAVIE
jgi:hypothetical protein